MSWLAMASKLIEEENRATATPKDSEARTTDPEEAGEKAEETLNNETEETNKTEETNNTDERTKENEVSEEDNNGN